MYADKSFRRLVAYNQNTHAARSGLLHSSQIPASKGVACVTPFAERMRNYDLLVPNRPGSLLRVARWRALGVHCPQDCSELEVGVASLLPIDNPALTHVENLRACVCVRVCECISLYLQTNEEHISCR